MFIEILASKMSLSKRKLMQGYGINDSTYTTEIIINGKRLSCPYYNRWKDMISRCYSDKRHERYPTYKDCTVCDEWLYFSNFRSWMLTQ